MEHWTTRYSGTRVASGNVQLKPALKRIWKYKPRGVQAGTVRCGDRGVFTTGGAARLVRLDLLSGTVAWIDEARDLGNLLVRWGNAVVVSGLSGRDYRMGQPGFVRAVEIGNGVGRWQKTSPARGGSAHSYVVGDLLVDSVGGTRVIDLTTLNLLWSSPTRTQYPLVGDHNVVLAGDGDIICHELHTGRVRWSRTAAEVGGGAFGLGCMWNGAFIVRSVGDAKGLAALDLSDGDLAWKAPGYPLMWWHPYDGRGYGFTVDGRYVVIDLLNGQVVLDTLVSPRVPVAVKGEKPAGRQFQAELGSPPRWQNATLAVSETHAFIMNESGQIVVLKRDSGVIEQTVEIDGKPMSQAEPVIYEGHLLVTDFDAAVYCFKGGD